jgi:hypothetical protein
MFTIGGTPGNWHCEMEERGYAAVEKGKRAQRDRKRERLDASLANGVAELIPDADTIAAAEVTTLARHTLAIPG